MSESSLSRDEATARSALAAAIPGHVFPGDRNALLEAARSEHATQPILDVLAGLPGGRTFENVQDVWAAVGGDTEERT